jgi:hypothetical protein
MRYLVIILLFVCVGLKAQRSGTTVYLEADTLKGADTVYVEFPEFKSFYSLSLELNFKELGGTSDGACYLLAANDTNYVSLTSAGSVITANPNDTIDIADGLTAVFWIYGNPANNFKYMCIGTVGDTTIIQPNYIRK